MACCGDGSAPAGMSPLPECVEAWRGEASDGVDVAPPGDTGTCLRTVGLRLADVVDTEWAGVAGTVEVETTGGLPSAVTALSPVSTGAADAWRYVAVPDDRDWSAFRATLRLCVTTGWFSPTRPASTRSLLCMTARTRTPARSARLIARECPLPLPMVVPLTTTGAGRSAPRVTFGGSPPLNRTTVVQAAKARRVSPSTTAVRVPRGADRTVFRPVGLTGDPSVAATDARSSGARPKPSEGDSPGDSNTSAGVGRRRGNNSTT